jgi:hypothetical protein
MNSRRKIVKDLKGIDPLREGELDRIEWSESPQLLLERVLSSDKDAPPPQSSGAPDTSTWRRRGPRLALGGGVALAAVATALIVSAGSDQGSTAFAVEPQDGGGVTIKVYSLDDAAGLEAALAEAGIRSQVTWLPAGMACQEPRFTPSQVKTSGGGAIGGGMTIGGVAPAMTIGIMTATEYRELKRSLDQADLSEDELRTRVPNITLDPNSFRPDQTVVISGAPGPSPPLDVIINGPTHPYEVDPQGGYEANLAVAEGPVEPCEPMKVPDGGMLEKTNQVIEKEAAERATQASATGPSTEQGSGSGG